MAHPVPWPRKFFFYPVGNTTPSCFIQGLAPEIDANALLLACGDPRSILYTAYADPTLGKRKLDFTCCDWEPAVIARNILLFSMIIDGVESSIAFSIFYHMFIDKTAHGILLKQCTILVETSVDLATWTRSRYGQVLRFCTQHSLEDARRCWELYLQAANAPPSEKAASKKEMLAGMSQVLKSYDPTRTKSVFVSPTPDISTRIKSHSEYWTTGVTCQQLFGSSVKNLANPTFVYSLSGKQFNVHYGTDPIHSFFLAEGFDLVKGSNPGLKELVQVAVDQFTSWSNAFRQRFSNHLTHRITIRFFVGDALAFAHALRYCHESGAISTGVYTRSWGGTQIKFLAHDYHGSSEPSTSSLAPTIFNIIDTSNLTDHIGLLNLLAVTVPLLDVSPGASLHTNTLHPSLDKGPLRSGLGKRALVDLPSLSLLLGVAPMSQTSHFTTESNKHLILSQCSQIHEGIIWKRLSSTIPGPDHGAKSLEPSIVTCDPKDLAIFLFSFYLRMFEEENHGINMRNMSLANMRKQDLIFYVRGSFVSVVRLVKPKIDTDWDLAIAEFMQLIVSDRSLMMGLHSYQELSCQFHLQGLWTEKAPPLQMFRTVRDRLHGWKDVPHVVCIVLKVPRQCVEKIQSIPANVFGSPPLQCETGGSTFHNLHPDIRPIFGDLKIGKPGRNGDAEISIIEDPDAFNGKSPLFVSFYIPALWIVQEPDMQVGLHIHTTPQTTLLIGKLGMRLTIFSTTLSDTEHVQVTRHRPNNPTEIDRLRGMPPREHSQAGASTTLVFDRSKTRIVKMALRDNITDAREKVSLSSGATVSTKDVAESSILVTYDGYKRLFRFPYPIHGRDAKTRIARKSSYIEIECSIRPDFHDFRDVSLNPFPVIQVSQFGVNASPLFGLINVHYINLDVLPDLRLKTSAATEKWMQLHLSTTMSSVEEKIINEKGGLADSKSGEVLDLKHSINNLVRIFSGFSSLSHKQGEKRPELIALTNPKKGIGVHTLIFINAVKLDLANHTVALDGCVIPLTVSLCSRLEPFLRSISQDLSQVPTDDDEQKAWKKLIPVVAERCRKWKHTPNCEYLTRGFPASLDGIEESPLCSCGKGRDLGAFGKSAKWKTVHKEATRIALSPLFTWSFLEDWFEESATSSESTSQQLSSSRPSDQGCVKCGGPGKPQLLVCGGCKASRYCSQECQKAHWKLHKVDCRKPS